MKHPIKIFLSLILINGLVLAGGEPAMAGAGGGGAGASGRPKGKGRTRMCAVFALDLWQTTERISKQEIAALQIAKANQWARIYCCEYKGELAIKMPLEDAVFIFAQTNPRGYAAIRNAATGKGPLRRALIFFV